VQAIAMHYAGKLAQYIDYREQGQDFLRKLMIESKDLRVQKRAAWILADLAEPSRQIGSPESRHDLALQTLRDFRDVWVRPSFAEKLEGTPVLQQLTNTLVQSLCANASDIPDPRLRINALENTIIVARDHGNERIRKLAIREWGMTVFELPLNRQSLEMAALATSVQQGGRSPEEARELSQSYQDAAQKIRTSHSKPQGPDFIA